MVVDTVEELQALQTTKDAEKNEAWIKIHRRVVPHNMGVVRGRLKKEERPLSYKKCLLFGVKKPGTDDGILESDDPKILVLAPKLIINRVDEIINDFPQEYGNSQLKEYTAHANNSKFFTSGVCKFAKTSKKKDGSEIMTLLREPTQTTNNGESSNAPEKRPAGAPPKKVAQTKAAPAAAPAEAPAAAKASTKGIRALFAPKNQPESAPAGSKENAPAAAKPAPKKAPVAAKPTGKAAPAAAKPAAAKPAAAPKPPAAAKRAPAAAKPTGKAAPAAAKAPEKPTPAAAKAATKATPAAPKHKGAAAPAAAAAEKRDREPSAPGDDAENPPKRPTATAKQAPAAPTVHMHSAAEFTFKNYDEMEKALFPSLSQNFESVKQGGFRVKVVTLAVPR